MTAPARFSIRPAALSEKPLVAAMFQPYYGELDRFPAGHPLEKDADGVYVRPYFDLYWREPDRYPYLLLEVGEVAGFALVRRDGAAWDLSEFYVLPGFRRRGLGFACACRLLERHPGSWCIRFNRANRAGRALWTSVAERVAGGSFERRSGDARDDALAFVVPGAPG